MTETATLDSTERGKTEIKLPADLEDLEVSMFQNAFSVLEPRPVKIVSLLSAIQEGRFKDRIKRLRGLKNNREAYDSAKKELPAVTLSGTFSKRNESCLTRYSGLIQLDFDHVPDPEKLRDNLIKDPHVCASFLSPGGDGVKAILKVHPDPQKHKSFFKEAEKRFTKKFGLKSDPSCKDLSRLCFISDDPDLKTNPAAKKLTILEENRDGAKRDPPPRYKYGSTRWVEVFRSAGMFLSEKSGKPLVRCPWEQFHTTGKTGDSSTVILTDGGKQVFHCSHQHCSERGPKDLEEFFGFDLVAAHSEPWEPDHENKSEKKPNFRSLDPEEEIPLRDHLKSGVFGEDSREGFFLEYNPLLESAIEKIARGHGLTYETALSAFLGMASVAVGGFKSVSISGGWTEKALLWMAFVAPSGAAKTPLFRDCGRETLAAYNASLDELRQNQKLALREWKNLPPSEQKNNAAPEVDPARMAWITYSTPETLAHHHQENPCGLGIVADELDGLLSGRGQYKQGRGDDSARLTELWNGREFSNPTISEYRYLPDTFVPILGGLQRDLLPRLINSEDVSSGFAARFLMVPFRSRTPALTDSQRREVRAEINGAERKAISDTLNRLLQKREDKLEFEMTRTAEDLLFSYHDELTERSSLNIEEASSCYQKLKSYTIRISLLLHLIKGESGPIDDSMLLDATDLMRWYCRNMENVFSYAYGQGRDQTLFKILEKVRKSPKPMSGHDLYQSFRRRIQNMTELKKYLGILLKLDLLEEILGPKGGKQYFTKNVFF